MKNFEKKLLLNVLRRNISAEAKILDVGCGVGNNLELLLSSGYPNLTGTDISDQMLLHSRHKGFICKTVGEIMESPEKYDLILFSHVLEHIEYTKLQPTLEMYFSKLNKNGRILVLCPILYDGFFADVDHIKPYYPMGLTNLFSDRFISRQYASSYTLQLLDLTFRREALMPYSIRCRFMQDSRSRITFLALHYLFEILRLCSLNLLAKTTGYVALFSVGKDHQ